MAAASRRSGNATTLPTLSVAESCSSCCALGAYADTSTSDEPAAGSTPKVKPNSCALRSPPRAATVPLMMAGSTSDLSSASARGSHAESSRASCEKEPTLAVPARKKTPGANAPASRLTTSSRKKGSGAPLRRPKAALYATAMTSACTSRLRCSPRTTQPMMAAVGSGGVPALAASRRATPTPRRMKASTCPRAGGVKRRCRRPPEGGGRGAALKSIIWTLERRKSRETCSGGNSAPITGSPSPSSSPLVVRIANMPPLISLSPGGTRAPRRATCPITIDAATMQSLPTSVPTRSDRSTAPKSSAATARKRMAGSETPPMKAPTPASAEAGNMRVTFM
mmetsp:Transcript_38847/g.128641  ORF Transcript_38847/g.128641 Transcript_38847/m.128641 type:complete len:338 (+) Transcript_38847:1724-2737(+)